MKFKISDADKNKIGVYCITNNLNGKLYIGSTGNSFYNRYHQHLSDYRKGKHNGVILKRAFDKHGIHNFSFSIMCICGEDERLTLEQFYINKGVDYNSAMIAGSLMGYKHPANSKTRTVVGGKHHSSRAINRYDIEGKFLQEHDCIRDACKELKIPLGSATHIGECCNGIAFSASGFRWSWRDKLLSKRTDNRANGSVKIIVKKGTITKKCYSQIEAAMFIRSFGNKCNQGRINRSLNLTGEKVYGFTIKKL